MGINTAKLYIRVSRRIDGLEPVQYEAAELYIDALSDFRTVATRLLAMKLTDAQRSGLMAQIDKSCYRAEDFIGWSKSAPAEFVSEAASRTAEIFEWIADDQTFYTALSDEVKDKEGNS